MSTDITKLIADLRIAGKTWREEIGDMPLFDRAADALEAGMFPEGCDPMSGEVCEAKRRHAANAVARLIPMRARLEYDLDPYVIARAALEAEASTKPTDPEQETKTSLTAGEG